jgi:hypothetical protein
VRSADQILLARLAGVCSRHCGRGRINDLDSAVAELRELAGQRPELLAEHAGVALGMADLDPVLASRFRAEAELCRAAGADRSKIEQWITVGRARAEQARQAPYARSQLGAEGRPRSDRIS